jgi:hypothetical protein
MFGLHSLFRLFAARIDAYERFVVPCARYHRHGRQVPLPNAPFAQHPNGLVAPLTRIDGKDDLEPVAILGRYPGGTVQLHGPDNLFHHLFHGRIVGEIELSLAGVFLFSAAFFFGRIEHVLDPFPGLLEGLFVRQGRRLG